MILCNWNPGKWALRKAFVWILIAIVLIPALVHGKEPDRDALFHIERNKNANIVQYDAQLGTNGLLHAKEPVVAYWVRLAEEGQTKELTWVQRKFAYGFTVTLNEDENTAILDMAADLGRSIMVVLDGADYRAMVDINGVTSYVDKLFIQASGEGLSTRVDHIELYGTSVQDSSKQYERLTP